MLWRNEVNGISFEKFVEQVKGRRGELITANDRPVVGFDPANRNPQVIEDRDG
jgi:hypothetical protein